MAAAVADSVPAYMAQTAEYGITLATSNDAAVRTRDFIFESFIFHFSIRLPFFIFDIFMFHFSACDLATVLTQKNPLPSLLSWDEASNRE